MPVPAPAPDQVPALLGRGAVVAPGQASPPHLADAPRVRVDEDLLADRALADRLHVALASRTPVVVELGLDPSALTALEHEERAPFELTPAFEFPRERLRHLVWANNYDHCSGEPVWWWARKAARCGAVVGGPADVVLDDGTPAFVDGGPREPLSGLAHPVVHRESVEAGTLAVTHHQAPRAPLAPDQLAAVAHSGGAARVIAPAGSGKTRVLTERLRHLIGDRGFEPSMVTALAFNKRAAAELRQRAGDVGVQVRTVHALGLTLLRQAAKEAGRPEPQVLEEWDVRRRLEPLVAARPRENTDVLAPYLEALAAVRIGLTAPDEVERTRDDVPGFAALYPRYRDVLVREHALDFDELVFSALELLLRHPQWRARAQARCRHLLVDEFQDLTPAYLLMIRLLAAPAFQVFGVGDDDQVIYGWAGATPRFLIDYGRFFPGAAEYALEVNYRCPEDVVSAASTLLAYNEERVPKTIRAAAPAAEGGLSVTPVSAADTAEAVRARVTDWLGDGAEPAQVAVLARVNVALLGPQLALGEAGVPNTAPLSETVLRRTGCAAALAYLRLATADPDELASNDLVAALARPARKVTGRGTGLLQRRPRWSVRDLHAASDSLPERQRSRFTGFLDDVARLRRAVDAGATSAEVLAVVRDEVGLGRSLRALDASRPELDRSGHADDLTALVAAGALCPDPAGFEGWLRERLALPADPDGVTLSSVHRVKGMEWPKVAVVGATEGLFPHELAEDFEEERRVFHVAITRCVEEVAVLADVTSPSRFVEEMYGRAPRTAQHRTAGERPAQRERRAAAPPGPEPLPARVGLTVVAPGGMEGEIVEVGDDEARLRVGAATMAVAFGDTVRVGGKRRTLAAPARDLSGLDVDAALNALRAWRTTRAEADGVPAYVIAHNAHLEAVAKACPNSLEELGGLPGMGPTRLRRYGEEILAALAEAAGAD